VALTCIFLGIKKGAKASVNLGSLKELVGAGWEELRQEVIYDYLVEKHDGGIVEYQDVVKEQPNSIFLLITRDQANNPGPIVKALAEKLVAKRGVVA
jgi:hypothetical protein